MRYFLLLTWTIFMSCNTGLSPEEEDDKMLLSAYHDTYMRRGTTGNSLSSKYLEHKIDLDGRLYEDVDKAIEESTEENVFSDSRVEINPVHLEHFLDSYRHNYDYLLDTIIPQTIEYYRRQQSFLGSNRRLDIEALISQKLDLDQWQKDIKNADTWTEVSILMQKAYFYQQMIETNVATIASFWDEQLKELVWGDTIQERLVPMILDRRDDRYYLSAQQMRHPRDCDILYCVINEKDTIPFDEKGMAWHFIDTDERGEHSFRVCLEAKPKYDAYNRIRCEGQIYYTVE